MRTFLFTLAILFSLSACTDSYEATQTNQNSAADLSFANSSQAVIDKYKQIYQISSNSNGVVIFDKPEQMFEALNDYPSDTNQFEKLAEKPLSIRISHRTLKNSPQDVLKGETEIALLYGILKTFTHTNVDKVIVKSVSIDENNKFMRYSLNLTVDRKQTLTALKNLKLANSFDDLVETKPNNQFRFVGLSGSEIYDDIVYKEQNRKQLIESLK